MSSKVVALPTHQKRRLTSILSCPSDLVMANNTSKATIAPQNGEQGLTVRPVEVEMMK